jgi:hypothetical protein
MGLTYSDITDNLKDISLTEPLNVEQAKIVPFAQRVMWAAERRAEGDFGPILEILEEIKRESGGHACLSGRQSNWSQTLSSWQSWIKAWGWLRES